MLAEESEMPRQLSFSLNPDGAMGPAYLVRHSGVSSALLLLEEALRGLKNSVNFFRLIFIFGPEGAGKTFIQQAFQVELAAEEILPERFKVLELSEAEENDADGAWVPSFVQTYEALKTSGGVFVVTSRKHPAELRVSEHAKSRFFAGDIVSLDYPQEDELEPLLRSFLERKNLSLPDSSIRYLLRHLPAEPLSFSKISAKIESFTCE